MLVASQAVAQRIDLTKDSYIEGCTLYQEDSFYKVVLPLSKEFSCAAEKNPNKEMYKILCKYSDDVERGTETDKRNGRRGKIEYIYFGYISTPNGLDSEGLDASSKKTLLQKLKSPIAKCNRAGGSSYEPYPVGSIFLSYVWGRGHYGYSGTVVEVVEPEVFYRVRIDHIDLGSWNGLNADRCSENQDLDPNHDIGKIITVQRICYQEKK